MRFLRRPRSDTYAVASLSPDLRGRWLELWDAQPTSLRTPFLHPDVSAATAAVLPDTEVTVVEHDGRAVAFLPFERKGRRGAPVAEEVSNGDGMLVEEGLQVPLAAMVRQAGLRHLDWTHRDVHRSPMSPYDHFVAPAAMVDLRGGFDVYAGWLNARSSLLKQTDRKCRKLSRERGPVVLTLEDAHDHAATLLEWKSRNLHDRGQAAGWHPGAAADLIAAFGAIEGPVRSVMSVLRTGDEVIALNWGLAAGGRYVSCIPAYAGSLSRHSPGAILHVELLRSLPDIDVTLVDLGLGLDQTKRRLATHTTPMAAGSAYASLSGRTYRRLRTVARAAVGEVRGRRSRAGAATAGAKG